MLIRKCPFNSGFQLVMKKEHPSLVPHSICPLQVGAAGMICTPTLRKLKERPVEQATSEI